jgi:hypothetical protein
MICCKVRQVTLLPTYTQHYNLADIDSNKKTMRMLASCAGKPFPWTMAILASIAIVSELVKLPRAVWSGLT